MGSADRTEEKTIAMLIQMMVTTDKHDGGGVDAVDHEGDDLNN